MIHLIPPMTEAEYARLLLRCPEAGDQTELERALDSRTGGRRY